MTVHSPPFGCADLVDVMFGLIWASKEGDWMLHLAFIRGIIPCALPMRGRTVHGTSPSTMLMSRLAIKHLDIFFFFFNVNGNTERAQCALSRVCIS